MPGLCCPLKTEYVSNNKPEVWLPGSWPCFSFAFSGATCDLGWAAGWRGRLQLRLGTARACRQGQAQYGCC